MQQHKNNVSHTTWLAPLLLALTLSGCGGADMRTETTTTTTGQELLDLKKAYDAGVLTEREYERKREEILERD